MDFDDSAGFASSFFSERTEGAVAPIEGFSGAFWKVRLGADAGIDEVGGTVASGEETFGFDCSFLASSASFFALIRSIEEASSSCFCHFDNDVDLLIPLRFGNEDNRRRGEDSGDGWGLGDGARFKLLVEPAELVSDCLLAGAPIPDVAFQKFGRPSAVKC